MVRGMRSWPDTTHYESFPDLASFCGLSHTRSVKVSVVYAAILRFLFFLFFSSFCPFFYLLFLLLFLLWCVFCAVVLEVVGQTKQMFI